MEVPPRIEHALGDLVARELEAALGGRELLLTAGEFAAAEADVSRRGALLRTWVIQNCYPVDRREGRALTVEFENERVAARLDAALAFGAVIARVLAPGGRDSAPFADSVGPVCAIFNLGIGLVDGLCDSDVERGAVLLELIRDQDPGAAAEERRARGWLRATLPKALADNATAAFTAEIIEAFFETLHGLYPADPGLDVRRRVGAQLSMALEAERRSVCRSATLTAREQLIDCSRLTSVLPFQIIETLARGDHSITRPAAGALLGEAMWRIDDLVDLCQDARSGSLNAVLFGTATSARRPPERDLLAALERLITSTDVARVAGEAAEKLLAGLRRAGTGDHPAEDRLRVPSFLYFVQRYAGIAPRPPS